MRKTERVRKEGKRERKKRVGERERERERKSGRERIVMQVELSPSRPLIQYLLNGLIQHLRFGPN